eukprot:1456190-Heterocapsa_arctica.AAC.1
MINRLRPTDQQAEATNMVAPILSRAVEAISLPRGPARNNLRCQRPAWGAFANCPVVYLGTKLMPLPIITCLVQHPDIKGSSAKFQTWKDLPSFPFQRSSLPKILWGAYPCLNVVDYPPLRMRCLPLRCSPYPRPILS